MVVILEPEDFQGWLTCPVDEAKAKYCKQWHGELVGEPAASPKLASAAPKTPKVNPKEPPEMGAMEELF